MSTKIISKAGEATKFRQGKDCHRRQPGNPYRGS